MVNNSNTKHKKLDWQASNHEQEKEWQKRNANLAKWKHDERLEIAA